MSASKTILLINDDPTVVELWARLFMAHRPDDLTLTIQNGKSSSGVDLVVADPGACDACGIRTLINRHPGADFLVAHSLDHESVGRFVLDLEELLGRPVESVMWASGGAFTRKITQWLLDFTF